MSANPPAKVAAWIDLRDRLDGAKLKLATLVQAGGQKKRYLVISDLSNTSGRWAKAQQALGFSASAQGDYLWRLVRDEEVIKPSSFHAVWPNAIRSEMALQDIPLNLAQSEIERLVQSSLEGLPEKTENATPTTETTPYAARQLDQPSPPALERAPTSNGRSNVEQGDLGAGAHTGGRGDSTANADTGGAGAQPAASLGDDAGALPVPSRGDPSQRTSPNELGAEGAAGIERRSALPGDDGRGDRDLQSPGRVETPTDTATEQDEDPAQSMLQSVLDSRKKNNASGAKGEDKPLIQQSLEARAAAQTQAARQESQSEESAREFGENYDRVANTDDLSTVSAKDIVRAIGWASRRKQSEARKGWDGGQVNESILSALDLEIVRLKAEESRRANFAQQPQAAPEAASQIQAPPGEAAQAPVNPTDFVIEEDFALGVGGQKTKYRQNADAIRLLKQLQAQNRFATPGEQAVLAKYVGWGGLAQAFDENNQDWAKEFAELRGLLTDAEYADARRSTRYAHYTSRPIVNAMYEALRLMGFTGGKILEAGAGAGNFMGLMPAELRASSRMTGVEREPIASGIAKLLYPNQNMQMMDFTAFQALDGYFDANIGNPPFAADPLVDQSGRKHLSGFAVHDYFFAKSIDMLRDGGVFAAVVSNGFMDKKGDKARKYIGSRAKLLGAIRLPNNAFSKNANTEVTTDIVFFQKLPESQWGSKAAKEDLARWLDTALIPDPKGGEPIAINQYFADNPSMMLGEFGRFGSMYGPDKPALVARPGQDTETLLNEAVTKLPQGIYVPTWADNPQGAESESAGQLSALHDTTVDEGGYYVEEGCLYQRMRDRAGEASSRLLTPQTQWTEKTKLGETKYQRLVQLAGLRKTMRQLLAAEMADDNAMTGLRQTLNEQYDTYVRAHGLINDVSTSQVFIDDPDYPLLAALELNYERGLGSAAAKTAGIAPYKSKANKAPIFEHRVIEKRAPVQKASNPEDALNVSIAERGTVDVEYIGQLLGRPGHEALESLTMGERPLLFVDPATGQYVLRDAYLSGNVRKKLQQAQAAGADSNARELLSVQPEDVGAHEISAKLGAPWVLNDVLEDFAKHLLGEGTRADIRYMPLNSSFSTQIRAGSNALETVLHGTPDMPASRIFDSLLNNRVIRVTYTDHKGTVHIDKEKTDAANEKAHDIKAKFQDWLFADPDRSNVLVRAYNDTNNNYVTRSYDGSYLTFEGKVPDSIIKFRRHQRNAIARIIQERTALLDHVVGAGKAQPLDAKILTPNGWKRMGDIAVGDMVISANGQATAVEAVFPQGEKEIFKVVLSDGSSTECCDEHLWLTQTYRERGFAQRGAALGKSWECGQARVRSLAEIRTTLVADHLGAKNHSIPMVEPVQFDARPVPLAPYLLGVLLGDGGFSHTGVTITSADPEIIERCELLLPAGGRLSKVNTGERCQSWTLIGDTPAHGTNPVKNALDTLELRGLSSHDKFIPADYLFNTIEARTELLRGLMDTDGSVSKGGHSSYFYTCSPQLADGVTTLVQSLGGLVKKSRKMPSYWHNGEKRAGRECFVLCIAMPPEINPFALKRKAQKVVPKSSYIPRRFIVAVEPVGMKPAQCIRVADESHLYVTDDFIVTHNTFAVIAAAMELKRTGLAKKPMIAVPNHLVKQWATDFYRLYPGANILTATKKDFERQNRRKFLAKIATGNWDAVIIAHSSFGFIQPDPEFEITFNEQQVAQVVQAIEQTRAEGAMAGASRRTVKQLEGMKERLENRIKSLRDRPVDNLLDFKQIGVDQLFIDEAHNFKNLAYATKMQNVRGLGDSKGSQRAYDMYLKVNQIFAQNGRGQGVVFATGTPVSNSMAEMYHMMRYLMPQAMEDGGFSSFDGWANTFAEINQVWMQKPSGDGYKAVETMGTFSNVHELLKMFDQVADTVTMDDIKRAYAEENDGKQFPLPKLTNGKRTPVSLEKSPSQLRFMEAIAKRASALEKRKGKPQKGQDNHLSIMSDARKAAMDIRLVDMGVTTREKSARIDRSSDEVIKRYKQYDSVKGTQLVFSDLGTPLSSAKKELKEYEALQARIAPLQDQDLAASAALGDEAAIRKIEDAEQAQEELDAKGGDWLGAVQAAMRGFSVYDDLKAALIEKGIPANEIAFIHDYNTDDQKAGLFRNVNSGAIRVLIGSTPKMGAGTNVQERLVALHHLDVPWRPSDIEQREGRIIRQGNKLIDLWPNFEVEILAYVTQDTLDMRMWQTQEIKLKMINQLRTRQISREIENPFEEAEMSAGEMQAAATGNVDMLVEIQLRNEVKKLEQRMRSFVAQRNDLINRKRSANENIERLPQQIEELAVMAQAASEYLTSVNERAFKVLINGTEFTSRAQAEDEFRRLTSTNEAHELLARESAKGKLSVNFNGKVYTSKTALGEALIEFAGDRDPLVWVFNGTTFNRRSLLAKAIEGRVMSARTTDTAVDIGKLGQFEIKVEGAKQILQSDFWQFDISATVGNRTESTTVSADGTFARSQCEAVMRGVERLIEGFQARHRYAQVYLQQAEKSAADLSLIEMPEKWPEQDQLETKRAQHKALLARMSSSDAENKPAKAPESGKNSVDETSANEFEDENLEVVFSRQRFG
jgi:N12 class adenine-specific DNA methylase